jgi:hypothetical protein
MDIIKPKNKLKTHLKLAEISKGIIDKIQSIPNYQELKNDLETLLYICTLVENEIKQTKSKTINKKEIVLDILQKIFNLKSEEVTIISKHIEFLHINELIKKITDCEKATSLIYKWCLRKIG